MVLEVATQNNPAIPLDLAFGFCQQNAAVWQSAAGPANTLLADIFDRCAAMIVHTVAFHKTSY